MDSSGLGRDEVRFSEPRAGHRRVPLALHGRYKLGIISGAIVTVGLRRFLETTDSSTSSATLCSDEAGASKPAARVFELAQSGCWATSLPTWVIVANIAGPNAYGSHSVLYTGVVDRRQAGDPVPSLIVSDMTKLPDAIAGLGQ